MVRLDSLHVGRASLTLPWAILRMTVEKAGAGMCRLGFFVPHKSTHNRTSPLETETSGNSPIDYYDRPKSVINKSSNVVSH